MLSTRWVERARLKVENSTSGLLDAAINTHTTGSRQYRAPSSRMPAARSEGGSTPLLVGRPAEEGRPQSRTAGAAALGRSIVSEVVVIAAVTALPGRKPARAPGAGSRRRSRRS